MIVFQKWPIREAQPAPGGAPEAGLLTVFFFFLITLNPRAE